MVDLIVKFIKEMATNHEVVSSSLTGQAILINYQN